jgi:hypothetical protein
VDIVIDLLVAAAAVAVVAAVITYRERTTPGGTVIDLSSYRDSK